MLVDIYIFYKRNEMFYLIMHSKLFIYGYMSDIIMVKDHSDSERKPAAATTNKQQG